MTGQADPSVYTFDNSSPTRYPPSRIVTANEEATLRHRSDPNPEPAPDPEPEPDNGDEDE